jgi:eukaryotic-like serine/threonine-protein kinase
MDLRTMVGGYLGAYRLDELLGQNELGPLFAATGTDARQGRYLLRPLTSLASPDADSNTPTFARLGGLAAAVAALQHPYILPLVDFGIAGGLPYLVWPQVSARSVSARLAQSGPVDVLTAGRYLDQLASALEYAHEHRVLHLSLTTDSVQLQADGRIVLADFGVFSMLQLGYAAAQGYPLAGIGDATAPELLLGASPSPATDVYALGAALYRLLTAHPVFAAPSAEATAQLHLSAPVPPLATWRANLPPALDDIMASAMAKQPGQRFEHPGALANAYHHVVAPGNSGRVPFTSAAATTPSNTLAPPAPRAAPPMRAPISTGSRLQAGMQPTGAPWSGTAFTPTAPPAIGTEGPLAPLQVPRFGSSLSRNLLWTGLLGLVIVATVLSLALLRGALPGAPPPLTGTAAFSDGAANTAIGVTGRTDSVKITVSNLPAPGNGTYYDAWLVDTANESRIFPLGSLTGSGSTYSLTYTGLSAAGATDANLLGVGNRLEITLEQGAVNVPVGRVVLSGTWPAEAFQHIRHLLVAYPDTPNHVGLVVGLVQQAQVLNVDAFALDALANSHDPVVIQCSAQSMLDILEGSHGQHYRPLPAACAAHNITETGDGYGLLGTNGYLSNTATHASNAATAPDATDLIREHAGHVRIAVQNITGWLTTVDEDAVALLNNPSDLSKLSEIVNLADHAYHGVHTSEETAPGPVLGEAGALTAYDHAQFMATLPLAG